MSDSFLSTVKKIADILTRTQKKSIAALLMLMILSSGIETLGISIIIPYFAVLTNPNSFITGRFGKVISDVFNISEQNEILIFLTAVLIVAFGLKYLLSYVIRLKQTNFINCNRFMMAQRVMRCLICEDYESYLYRNTTEEINLVTTHVTWTFELIGAILSMMVQILNVLFLSIFMLVVDYKITLCFGLGTLLLYYLFNRALKNKFKLAGEKANKTWEEYDKTINESFLLKKENNVFKRNDNVFYTFSFWGKKNVEADEEKIKYGIIPGLITNLISVWAILFFVLFSLASGNNIVSSIGKLSAFYLAVTRIIPGVNSILSCSQLVLFYRPSLDKVNEILESFDNNVYEQSMDFVLCRMNKDIELNDVFFRYRNTNSDILEHICLKIQQGERIGIVGKTGSGKTTLINLIIGLLKPNSGEVCIDGSPLTDGCILDVGYVPQDTNLLDSTIRDNIVFGRKVEDDEMVYVLQASGLFEFIEQLPDGLNTRIGTQGVRLSGGQRQRIGIARALIGSPSVLIFDESTSSLDLKTEQEIIKTIKAFDLNKTVIMISHRPNTLQFCDRWFCVENHQVREIDVCP